MATTPPERPCGETPRGTHSRHRYMLGDNVYRCPGGDVQAPKRPPSRLYEVRTVHGEAYWADGDIIEQDVDWLTIWGDGMTIALRVPTPDVWALRQIDPDEMDAVRDAADLRELGEYDAALSRVRELHREANNGTTCVYCAHGQRLGYDTTWPCDTIRALNGEAG